MQTVCEMSCVPCRMSLKVLWFGLVAIFLYVLTGNKCNLFVLFFLAIVLWSCNFHRPWNQRIQNVFLLIFSFFSPFLYKITTKKQNISTFATLFTSIVHCYCCINQPINWVLKWCMHLHKVKWEMKSWIPHGHSSHNNMCSYQSNLHPLSCQEAIIRYRLNTDSWLGLNISSRYLKDLSHDSSMHCTQQREVKIL